MDFIDILKAFLPLVLIVILLYGLLVFVKRYGISFKNKGNRPVKINVLSTQMLMPKKYISVVKVHDKVLVLGVSEGSINVLKELDDSAIDPFPPQEVNSSKQENFLDIFKKNLGLK